MPGDVSSVKLRKSTAKGKTAKSKENGINGVKAANGLKNGKSSAVKPTLGSSKTSLLVKSMFYTLLSIFVIIATLVSIDYRTGHLSKAYETNIPTEIRQHIDKGAVIAVEGFNAVYSYYESEYKRGVALARSWVKDVDVGGISLEEVLFADEIEEEKIETTRKAAEKIKQVVDAINKKVAEDEKLNHQNDLNADKRDDDLDTKNGDEELEKKLELEKQKIKEEADRLSKQKGEEEVDAAKREEKRLAKEKEEMLKLPKEVDMKEALEKERLEKEKLEETLRNIEQHNQQQKEELQKLKNDKDEANSKPKLREKQDPAAEAKRKHKVETQRKKVQDEANQKLEMQRQQILEESLENLKKKQAEIEMATKDEIERQRLVIIHKAAREQFSKQIEKAKTSNQKSDEQNTDKTENKAPNSDTINMNVK